MAQSQTRWEDHFSQISGDYQRFRPTYPERLYRFLSEQCANHDLAWDCATGTGQAATALAKTFSRVVASDASPQQIDQAQAQAVALENISFQIAAAESVDLPDNSVDLVTVAQALHWFPLDAFYTEVKRVLKPDGLLAVWSYGVMTIDNPAVQKIVDHFYSATLAEYWSPKRRWVEEGYRNLAFPFDELNCPQFSIRSEFDHQQLCGYLGTWSATQKWRQTQTQDPFPKLCTQLATNWPDSTQIMVEWPVLMRLGKA